MTMVLFCVVVVALCVLACMKLHDVMGARAQGDLAAQAYDLRMAHMRSLWRIHASVKADAGKEELFQKISEELYKV